MEQLQANLGDKVVTVAVLRVDGKKMSLALFRQIPHVDCLTAQFKVNGSLKPWGLVAYKIPKEGNEWLLAERDGQLVRCSLDLPSLSDWEVSHHEKSVAEYEEKLKGIESLGKYGAGIASLYRSNVERHQEELSKVRTKLAANKLRHAALTHLKMLPQLFLG